MRLIDADALIKRMVNEPVKEVQNVDFQAEWFTRIANTVCHMIDMAHDAPTIDAVPVVRCKECKWYSIYEAKKDGTPDKRYSPSVCLRGIYAKRREPNWFCADGERREG